MANIFDSLLMQDDMPPDVRQRAAALGGALRRDNDFGVLMQMMGTDALSNTGKSLQQSAQGGLQMAVEKQRDAERRKIEEARYQSELARTNEEREYRRSRDARDDWQWGKTFGLQQDKANQPNSADEARVWRGEDMLRGQYDRQMGDTVTELAATGKVKQLAPSMLGRTPSAVEQQSLVILLNKFLDANSVVREGEFNRVVEAQGLENRAKNVIARIVEGKPLGADMIQDIIVLSDLYEKAALARGKQISKGYWDTSLKRGFDPQNVVMDPRFQYSPPPDTVGAGPPQGAVRPRTVAPATPVPGAPANAAPAAPAGVPPMPAGAVRPKGG